MYKKTLIIFAVILIHISSCQLNKPVTPDWQTTYQIPFVIEKYILGEEWSDRPEIIIKDDTTKALWLSIRDSLNLDSISRQDLSIKPGDEHRVESLDTLEIERLDVLQLPAVNLRKLMPQLEQLIGETVIIPDTVLPGEATAPVQKFQSAHFLSGKIKVRISNNLPVPIGPNAFSDGLKIVVLRDTLSSVPFATVQFNQLIAPGDSVSQTISVGEGWLQAPLRFLLEIPISGAQAVTITDALLDNFGLSLSLELVDVKADEVVAILDPLEFLDTLRIAYDGEAKVRSAEILSGRIVLDIQNEVALGADVEVRIPQLKNQQSQVFSQTLTIPAATVGSHVLILDGYLIENVHQPNQVIDSLDAYLAVRTQVPQNFVHVTSRDSISIDMTSDSLILQILDGVIPSKTIDIPQYYSQDVVDYQGVGDGVTASEALLNIKVFNEVQVAELNGNIQIVGYKKDVNGNPVDSLELAIENQQIVGGVQGQPGTTNIILDSRNNPKVLELLNLKPTDFRISGQLQAEGDIQAALNSRIWASYELETPLRGIINDTTIYHSDIGTLSGDDIDGDLRDLTANEFRQAQLNLRISNHTPVAVTMRFFITSDSTVVNFFDPNPDSTSTILKTVSIPAAPTDPQSGFTESAVSETVTLQLSQSQIRIFNQPFLRYGYQFQFSETNGEVALRFSDFVEIRGELTVSALFDN
jgi:hypothetical protein